MSTPEPGVLAEPNPATRITRWLLVSARSTVLTAEGGVQCPCVRYHFHVASATPARWTGTDIAAE